MDAETRSLTLDQRKRAVRESALARRGRLSASQIEQKSGDICTAVTDLPEIESIGSLLCFASFGTEVDTRRLMIWCIENGISLSLPRVLAPRVMAAFRVKNLDADLEPGAYGIPEPKNAMPQMDPGDIDAVIVPGSAFDDQGGRIGYGGGFYDTYMRKLRAGTPRIALAFQCQLCDQVPREPHDLKVDILVTERRVLRFHDSRQREGSESGGVRD